MESLIQKVYYSAEILTKKPHFHTCHQIILITKGNVEFYVNDKMLRAEAGDLAIFSCYEDHSVAVCSAEYERFVLQIDPAAVNREIPVYSLLTNRPTGFSNVVSTLPQREQIMAIFQQLIYEYNSAQLLANEMAGLLISQLLIAIFRCTGLEMETLLDPVVLDLKRQFERHFSEKYTLKSLADQYHISISSLSHRFQATTGTSVMDYLLSCRIVHAKQLLANSDHSIGEIIEKCGFSDNSNFSRTFKKLTGMSPMAFRKQCKAR